MTVSKLSLSHSAFLKGEEGSLWAQLTLQAPKTKPNKQDSRPPLDLVIVLDRSGSMGAHGFSAPVSAPSLPPYQPQPGPVWYNAAQALKRRIPPHSYGFPQPQPQIHHHHHWHAQPQQFSSPFEHARQAARMALSQLGPEDRSAVVVYDSAVDVIAPLSYNHAGNAQSMDYVSPRGATDLAGGLFTGADLLGGSGSERQRRVFLLSDGQANQGMTNSDQIASRVRQLAQQGIVVSSFGLGSNYNEELLTAIANAGGGGYYYLEHADQAGPAFNQELSEVFSVSIRGARLTVDLSQGVKLARKLGAGEQLEEGKPVIIGDIPAGGERVVLLELQLDKQASKSVRSGSLLALASIELSYKNASGKKKLEETHAVAVKLTRDESKVAEGLDHEVLAEAASFEAAFHQEQAASYADAGNFVAAQQVLSSSRARLDNYAARGLGGARARRKLEQLEENLSLMASPASYDASSAKSLRYASYQTQTSRDQSDNQS